MKLPPRFWDKVAVLSNGCWNWTANKNSTGYGRFMLGAKNPIRSHRASYQHFKGKIAEGMCICHTCDNPSCVNPAHLFEASHQGNMADMTAKGRHHDVKGENHHLNKLTEEDVLSIRDDERSMTVIAKDYGVTKQNIWRIKNKKTWLHI